ncbi:F-box domain-containing protein [Mycena kentingensis (nom. inval.)]|nr:F-box domain-containing protein [Mycena kentingensis (nom. inval.)]
MNDVPSSRLLASPDLFHTLVALLRNNASLPANLAACADEISTDLATQETTAALLRVQLSDVEREIEFLKRLSQLALAVSAPVAPIRRLPAELLVQIFRQHWIEFDETYDNIDHREFDPIHAHASKPLVSLALGPLLTVAQVCANWHEIVMGTPALWAELHLDAAIWRYSGDGELVHDLVAAGIQRSGDMPLFVSIYNQKPRDTSAFSDNAALSLLATTSHRWRTARLWCRPEDIPCLDAGLPLLEAVQAHSNTLCGLPEMPRLRAITYNGAHNIPKLPLEQLNAVRIQELPYDQLAALAAILPRLHGCVEISLFDAPAGSVDSEDLAILPPIVCAADKLSISFGRPKWREDDRFMDAVQRITTNLTAPHLRELFFKSNAGGGFLRWPHDAMIHFMKRSNTHKHLVALNLADVLISTHELTEVLREVAALEFLDCGDDDEGPAALDAPLLHELLEVNGDAEKSPKLVPHLQELWYSSYMEFDHELLLSFVEARVAWMPRFHLTLTWTEMSCGLPEAVFTPVALQRFGALQKEPRPSVTFSVTPLPYQGDIDQESVATCEVCSNYRGP